MERDLLRGLSREQVRDKLKRVNPEFSVSQSIADELSLTVFDQKEAMLGLGKRLAMWQSGLTESDKPIGVLFFAGPPGTGKTTAAEATAKWLGLPSEHLIRLDMSDYQEPHTAQKLTGSPPGYVGYGEESALPHRILNSKNKPTVVLLDEIEKAHPNVLKGLLSAFDKGELNARNGHEGFQPIDLTRTLFIMTSNIASNEVVQIEKHGSKKIGFNHNEEDKRDDEIQRVIKGAMKDKFPPEFLDRVDSFVRFKPLENEDTRRSILMKFVVAQNEQFIERWAGEAPYLMLTKEAQDFLLNNKDDKGGRGIKRMFHEHVISQLPDVMMAQDFKRRPFVADIVEGKTEWYSDDLPQLDTVLRRIEAPKVSEKKPTDPWFNLPEDNLDGGDFEDDLENGEEPPNTEEIKEKTLEAVNKMGGIKSIFKGEWSGKVVDVYIRVKGEGEDIDGMAINIPLGMGEL